MVTIGGNSGGCATDQAVQTVLVQQAVVHQQAGSGLLLVFGLRGAGASAPSVTGATIRVGGTVYAAARLARHAAGSRASELWYVAPPAPVGAPLVYELAASFSEPAYYHAMTVSTSGLDPVHPLHAEASSSAAGANYSTTVAGTNANQAVLSYLNGEIGDDLASHRQWCGSGNFPLHLDAQPGEGGHTTVAGHVSGIGQPDWLHSVWSLKP